MEATSDILLVDPQFDQEGLINLLLGADLYYELLAAEQIRLSRKSSLMQNTVFGWVIAGRVTTSHGKHVTYGSPNIDHSKLSEQM